MTFEQILCFVKNNGTLIASIIAAIVSIFNAYKISKLNLAAKIEEIKFSNLIKERVDKTKELYSNLSDLHRISLTLLTPQKNKYNVESLKYKIDIWVKVFQKSYLSYNRNKILFPDNIKLTLEECFDDLFKIRDIILSQKQSINEDQEEEAMLGHPLFIDDIEELKYVEKKIQKINSIKEVQELDEKSKIVRNTLENYFKKLLE